MHEPSTALYLHTYINVHRSALSHTTLSGNTDPHGQTDRHTSEPSLTHTGELWHSVGHLALAGSSVEAWRPVTGVQALAQRADVPRPTSGNTERNTEHSMLDPRLD